MPARSLRTPVAVAIVVLVAAALAPLASGVRAQDASPEATPTMPNCTADLGIVRSAKVCLSVVQASPDAPAVDVYLNGQKTVADLAFGQASGFLQLAAGPYQMQVAPAGTDVDQAVIDVPALGLVPARAYEIAVVGLLADISAQVYEVDVSALPEQNPPLESTRIRFVHALPDAPAVDVSLIADDIAQREVQGLTFPEASAYADRVAGIYRVMVNAASGDAVAPPAEAMFEGGKVYSVYLIGMVGDESLRLLLVGTTASSLPAATPSTPTATPQA